MKQSRHEKPHKAFSHYLEAWAAEGQPAAGRAAPLHNLRFARAGASHVTKAMGPKSAAICLHACTEASLEILQNCRTSGAVFAVMPNSLPEGLYGMDCHDLPDSSRYATIVGIIAEQFRAQKVCAIDGAITDHNLIILGPRGGNGEDGDAAT